MLKLLKTEHYKNIIKRENNEIIFGEITVEKETETLSKSVIPWTLILISCAQAFIYLFGNEKLFNYFIYTPERKSEIWRFMSYSLLHLDPIHLIINIFLQIVTAFALEAEQGYFLVLAIYVGGVLSGSLGTSLFHPELRLVGSSAGVYSLLMSHVPHFVLNFSSLSYRYYRIISVIVICLNDACFTAYRLIKGININPKISLAAHICGALNGLVLGFAIFAGARNNNLLKIIRCLCIILYGTWITSAIILNQGTSHLL